MTDQAFETDLNIGTQAIGAYSRLSYTMWNALAEFIDNSTQSRLNYEWIIDDVLRTVVPILPSRPITAWRRA